MILLDIILIKSSDSDELDIYRTRRKMQDLQNEMVDSTIFLHEVGFEELASLKLNGEFSIMLLAGDFIDYSFVSQLFALAAMDGFVFQPLFTYAYSQSHRSIYKNIDIHKDLATFDVLALRYYASRHVVSKSKDLMSFLNEPTNYDYSIWQNYLLWLLTSRGKHLSCIDNVISFEKIFNEFNIRDFKSMDGSSPSPVANQFFSRDCVLSRQNMNNVGIKEKQSPTVQVEKKTVERSMNIAEVQHPVAGLPNSSIINDNLEKKPVSSHNLREAISQNGVLTGSRLTGARLLKRAKRRADSKMGIQQMIKQTFDDIKETIEVK